MSDARHLTRIFKALAVETRVQMVLLLKERSLCVNALAQRLAITPAAISQHLRILRDADLVIAEKRGFYVHYRLNHETLAQWRTLAGAFMSVTSHTQSDVTPDALAVSTPVPVSRAHCHRLHALGETDHETSDDSHCG